MFSPTRLVLLYGGNSGEHEVSLVSAASVLAHLDANKYDIIPVGMDKDGQFYQNDYQELLAFKQALPVKTARSLPLEALFMNGRLVVDTQVVFPVAHGPLYEDGCLQGMLELANVAYVGCDVLSSAIGMDKDIARRLACVNGVKSARYQLFSTRDLSKEKIESFSEAIALDFKFPVIVKPCSMGSSVGIQKANNLEELIAAMNDAKRYDDEILVEEFLYGREIELAVLESKNFSSKPRVSVAGEIRVNHPDGIYSYRAKYLESEQTDLVVPCKLDEPLLKELQRISAEIFMSLKCKGMARVDFFVNENSREIYFNEVNTIPGFTPISMYPKLWAASGLSYPELLDELIELALAQKQRTQQLVTHYQ